MERIESVLPEDAGCFYLPVDELPTRVILDAEGNAVTCLAFDEMTALLVAHELEAGAYTLLNPGKTMPKRGIVDPDAVKKAYPAPTDLAERVLELETLMLEFHRSFGAEERAKAVLGIRQEMDALREQVRELGIRTLGLKRLGGSQ